MIILFLSERLSRFVIQEYKVYTLSDAYETGVIDDDMLYELYVWGNLWGKIDVTPKGEDRLSFQK